MEAMHKRNQKRPSYSVVWIFLVYCLSWTYSLQNDTYVITFKEAPNTHNVSAGSVVHLRCHLNFTEHVTFTHESNVLIHNSVFMGPRSKYSYNWTLLHDSKNVLHELVLNDVNDSDEGTYWCIQGSISFKQTDLEVLRIPQDKPHCNAMRLDGVNSSNKYMYQFNCSARALDPKVNISLFLNERPVTGNVSIFTNPEGERKEIVSWFSSYLDNKGNNNIFNCVVTHNLSSLGIHFEKNCSITVFHQLDKSATVPNTSVHRLDITPITSGPQSNDSVSINVAVLAAGFLAMSLLLILIGIKLSRSLAFARCDSGKRGSHAIDFYQVVNEPTENEESVLQIGNFLGIGNATASQRNSKESFASMIMVNNEIYESSNKDLLAGKTMVQNVVYESVVGVNSCGQEKQIYSTIQRNEVVL